MAGVVGIPDWELSGILPPWGVRGVAAGGARSPYVCRLSEVVARLGTTDHRTNLISGLLDYREQIRTLGFSTGFQWVDGSFVEARPDNHPPRDIDLLTVPSTLPASVQALGSPADQRAELNNLAVAHPELFEPGQSKAQFKVDAYWIVPDVIGRDGYTRQLLYWFSLFSHRRQTREWKGFLQIDLSDAAGDDEARQMLEALEPDEQG